VDQCAVAFTDLGEASGITTIHLHSKSPSRKFPGLSL